MDMNRVNVMLEEHRAIRFFPRNQFPKLIKIRWEWLAQGVSRLSVNQRVVRFAGHLANLARAKIILKANLVVG